MFLCDVAWSDGLARSPGKLTLWTADSLWKACLFAPTDNAVGFTSSQDPVDLLRTLEKQLASDKVEWRRSFERNAKRATKR
jgi:hypothetical protein